MRNLLAQKFETRSKELLDLAKPFLETNDFGLEHTERVLEIAKKHFEIPQEVWELAIASIILHDIGGSTIKEQYERGPKIARFILKKLEYDEKFIKEVCEIIYTHHDHPEHPSLAFKILHDSDKIVMFSPQEFFHYDSKTNPSWNKIIDLLYSKHSRNLAKGLLKKRRKDKWRNQS